ncbi:MAG: CHAT domain-containing protein [Kofleriaceae bacterium]|nr:CHAT domain-containing protein [Kofleriaceae bacterium]
MRQLSHAILLVVVLWSGWVAAQPQIPRRPNAAQQTEIDKLEKELTDQQLKQATFAAAKTSRKLYELSRKYYGEAAPQTLARLLSLAGMLQQINDYEGAILAYKAHLAAIEKVKGRDSRDTLYALTYITGPYMAQGRWDELEPYQTRALELTKKLDGEKSVSYAAALQTRGMGMQMRNELSSATRVYEEVLKVHESVAKGPNDLALLSPLQVLGTAYWQLGQHQKATAQFDRAIAIVTNSKDTNIHTVAGTLWAVAAQYHYGGRPDLAAPLRKRVMELFSQEIARLEATKPDDPMLSSLVGQLAFQHREEGDLVSAEKMFRKALALDEKRGSISGWGTSLADLMRGTGRPREALAYLEKAQTEMAKWAPQSGTAFSGQIGDVLREMGEYKRAEQVLTAYLANIEKTYSKRHPIYGMALLSIARVYMASKRIPDAERVLTASLETAERDLSLVLKTGTEADHAIYFARNNYLLDLVINFHLTYAPKSPAASRLGLTTLLRRKGRVLDAAAANLKTIRSKLSPDDKKLLDDLANQRATLAKLTVVGPSATGAENFAKEIAALEDQIQKLEIAVGKKSAAYRVVTQSIDLTAVQKLIPKDARLVEIVNYAAYDPLTPYTIVRKPIERRYAAYVVGNAGDPAIVDLGPAPAIEAAIENFRKAVADPANKKVFALGRDLHALTMAKIEPLLGKARQLLVAPDGALNVVPFSALVDAKQELLIKKYTFTYLTSGRDLLRLMLKSKAQGGGVMFADPSFDASGPAPTTGTSGSRGRRSSDLASLLWPPLPGTGQEADEIEKRMRGLTIYRGTAATETALKRVRGPKILHLATHGFFLPDEQPADAASSAARAAGPVGLTAPLPLGSFENPLLRSGLALAGANKLSSGDDDGILTAMEATGLDLWGTKLVVLSACETGVGKVTNGDGVYGLRRALVIAGAESLVMSLWQVDDIATKELMSGYYAKLDAGKPRSSALREVQLELAANKTYAHPFYWAAFLPAGDDSPLGK